MEVSTPSWMDIEFFEKILENIMGRQRAELKNVKITFFSGNSTASALCRAKIYYTKHTQKEMNISLIIKHHPMANDNPKQGSIISEAFKTEAEMYCHLLPDIHSILEIGGFREPMGPRLYMHLEVPTEILVMEDLLDQGYEMSKSRLNFEDTKVVFSKLAQFHGASFFLNSEQKKNYTKYHTGIFNTDRDNGLFQGALKRFLTIAKNWPEYKYHWQKLMNLEKVFRNAKKKIYNLGPHKSNLNVLNHGNFNIRNILLKRHQEKITNLKMVDFQSYVWCSPSLDIIYAMYLVADIDTLINHRRDLIRHYHRELINTLHGMGSLKSAPSLLDLTIDILKNGFTEVLVAICFLPFHYLSKDCGDDGTFFDNKHYQAFMREQLQYFIYNGFLD